MCANVIIVDMFLVRDSTTTAFRRGFRRNCLKHSLAGALNCGFGSSHDSNVAQIGEVARGSSGYDMSAATQYQSRSRREISIAQVGS